MGDIPFFQIYIFGPTLKCKKFIKMIGKDLPPTFTNARRKPIERNTIVENINTKNGAVKYKKKAAAAGTPKYTNCLKVRGPTILASRSINCGT